MCLCLVMSGEHASRLGRTQRRLSTGCHKAADTPPRRAHAPVHGSGALREHMHPVPSVEASLCRLQSPAAAARHLSLSEGPAKSTMLKQS